MPSTPPTLPPEVPPTPEWKPEAKQKVILKSPEPEIFTSFAGLTGVIEKVHQPIGWNKRGNILDHLRLDVCFDVPQQDGPPARRTITSRASNFDHVPDKGFFDRFR